jgi:hypothetical protein
MNGIVQWLLGLERIRIGDDAPLSIRFATPPAPWIMLVGIVLAVIVVFRVYRREALRGSWRWPLMALRLGVITMVLLLLGRPMLVMRRNQVEPSVVAVLVDRSASMARADVAASPEDDRRASPKPESRWSAALRAVAAPTVGLISRLLLPDAGAPTGERSRDDDDGRVRVELWDFGAGTSRIGSASRLDQIPALRQSLESMRPAQPRTDIPRALDSVLEQTRGARLSGIILVSDGRQTAASSLESALAQAQARSIPVYAVAAGSPVPPRDVAVTSLWHEEDVFVFDAVSLDVRLALRGFETPTPVEVELRNPDTGEVLSRSAVEASGGETVCRTELQYRPATVGRKTLRVVAVPQPGEEDLQNNRADVVINVHDERVSVLYVESVPRYEYRYLKNLLLRESTIESSCLLLDATPGFTQEGSLPIQRFPRSVEELNRYEVVILGDVDPRGDWLSPVQESMLVDFVSVQGGGVAFVAGERNMPHRLSRTRLEKLLPVRISPRFFGRYEQTLDEPFLPKLTPEGLAHPMFRFANLPADSRDLIATLPGWYWFALVEGPKPAASVLAVHASARGPEGPVPLAVLGRYGAGRTLYLGSDDLWRWRQYVGESYYENVWLQAIRTLARGRKLGPGRRWRLQTDRKQYDLGQSVNLELTDLRAGDLATVDEVPVSVRDQLGDLVGRLLMAPRAPAARPYAESDLFPQDAAPMTFEGRFIPPSDGGFTFYADVPTQVTQSQPVAASVTVAARDPERAQPEADYEGLKQLAERSGGAFHLATDDLGVLARSIPDRSVDVPDDVEESLWDTRLALLLFVGLITTEWIIRKAVGLT